MCAGATAASTNDVCGIGVAFEASVSGLRILGGPSSDAMEAQALTYKYHDNHIFSSSWGPTDNGVTLEGPGPLTKAALRDGATRGRDGKGSIYVWAAGNGARYGDNCNYDGYASSRYVLTVGAVNHFGIHAYYSEPCAAIIVCAPSSGQDNVGITTTSMDYDCTNDFTGTSAAAPLLAGVVALMLEVNNNLTYRDVHHIMALTARMNDLEDTDWTANGASYMVNHKYGFGVVDAHLAVLTAKNWSNVAEEVSFASPVLEVNAQILDNSHQAAISRYHVTTDITLEHVEVVFSASHSYRADLKVVLTSPSRTKSVLSAMHGTSSSYEFKIVSPKDASKSLSIIRSTFGPAPADWARTITTSVVAGNPLDGCSNFINAVVDRIVIVQRGNCNFVSKVKNAQHGKAAAVIVIPENENDPAVEMTGVNASSIAIPSAMLSGKDGKWLLLLLIQAQQASVTGTLSSRVNKQPGLIPFKDWMFSTVRNWGESSFGEWSLEVFDLNPGGEGTFDRWQLRIYGTKGNAAPPLPPHRSHTVVSSHSIIILVFVIGLVLLGVVTSWWFLRRRGRPFSKVEVDDIELKARVQDV